MANHQDDDVGLDVKSDVGLDVGLEIRLSFALVVGLDVRLDVGLGVLRNDFNDCNLNLSASCNRCLRIQK